MNTGRWFSEFCRYVDETLNIIDRLDDLELRSTRSSEFRELLIELRDLLVHIDSLIIEKAKQVTLETGIFNDQIVTINLFLSILPEDDESVSPYISLFRNYSRIDMVKKLLLLIRRSYCEPLTP